jgi:hypothetical protein
MKHFYLIILSISVVFTLFGQTNSTNAKSVNPKLLNVKDIVTSCMFDRTIWTLYAQFNKIEYTPVKAEDVIKDIDNYLLKDSTSKTNKGKLSEFNLTKKYRNQIDTTFQGLGLFGSDQLGAFIYLKESLPIHFAMMGDTALTFIISGVFIDNVYNTLKLTSRQRATKVITTYILPSLKAFIRSNYGKDIKYFGITCVYGSKNFADDGVLNTKPEYVAFIAPVKLIKQYVKGDLTEDELINSADIYLCDRDMVAEFKKIKITLE